MDWEKRRLIDATQAWLLSGAVEGHLLHWAGKMLMIDAASYFSLCPLVICLPHLGKGTVQYIQAVQ